MLDNQPASAAPDLIARLAEALWQAGFRGEIEADSALCAAMSTDNSVYQISPDLVVAPREVGDLVTLLTVMEHPTFSTVPITGRGGGTGTNGQSLNTGVIVDLRRHMNKLMHVNANEGWADVQPGIVLDDLNEQIRASGWFFAPETSTSTRCTIGGMVSTDASGKGSRVYGKTSDNIVGLEIARPEGVLSSMTETPDWARDMLTRAEDAARSGRKAFIDNTPKLNRRFTGYDLERACPEPGRFEWWRLFLGAEGTLGLITSVRVKLRRIEPEKRLIVASFDSFRNALSAAMPLLDAEPTAIEVMDEAVQALAEQAGILNRLPKLLRQVGAQRVAYVFIEINGDDPARLNARVDHCRQILATLPGAGASHVAANLVEIRELWAIRSAGVGLLGKVDGPARPIAFVEDTVVPPENLPAFVDEFLSILSQNGLGFGIYGHADVGCLHIRPALNIDTASDRARLVAVSDAVYTLTQKYGGIFWGEHGKGVRGAYLRDWIGPEAYRALQGVKAAFDPQCRFNPGKLVTNGTPVMGIVTTPFRAFNAPEGDPLTKAFRCNGNAQCLSYAATTPMCPSFKASADVRHSPKGRADALRAWHRARHEDASDLERRETDLLQVLDTCLGCKACASTCPVQVDIPSMRSAFYADYFGRHRRSFADRMVLAAERNSRLTLRMAPLLAPIWPLIVRIGEKLTSSVDIPRKLATELPKGIWLSESDLTRPLPENSVILVQDWFTALFDVQVQRDVIEGFTALGFKPRLLTMRPGGKAAHTAGDIESFHRMATALADLLTKAAATGAPLIAFEPAFGLMLRQEYSTAEFNLPPVQMPQEFLLSKLRGSHPLPRITHNFTAIVLPHCTEVSAQPETRSQWVSVFDVLGVKVSTPATGCCGMAGLFGHQKRHQIVSERLFDASWREVLKTGAPVYATGYSCRCQSGRLAALEIRHPLGLIADLLQPKISTMTPHDIKLAV